MTRTAFHCLSCSGEIVGLSKPGVTATAAARMENPGAKMRTFSKLAEKDKIQPQKIRSSVAFDNVMDGDLDGFLNAYLTQLATGELKK